ncbi:MAG TPA: CHASE3 domain-containing protein [Nitrospiraceae bacterium]|nr:CHASE3 domain-containing protein [Nitrospiraceae bacterium]
MKWPGLSRTAVFIALAVAFIAAQSVAAAGFLSLLHFRSTTQSVSRAQDVLLELESMVASLTKAETGQRGYILTGAEHFLFPYRDSLEAARGHLRRLIDLTRDNNVQQRHVVQLVRQVDERMDQLGEPIVARHLEGVHAAGNVVLANHDKRTMDSITRTVAEIRKEESQRLQSRWEDSTIWAVTAGALSVTMFLLMFVVFGFSFVAVALAFGKDRENKSLLSLPKPAPPLG